MIKVIIAGLIVGGLLSCLRWTTIPYNRMAYPTVGNWFWVGRHLVVVSAKLSQRRYEFLILSHETIEALLCGLTGVHEQDVTDFDVGYERNRARYITDVRPEGIHKLSSVSLLCYHRPMTWDSEPGDDPAAPYYYQHKIASFCERCLAIPLLVNWNAYEAEVDSL